MSSFAALALTLPCVWPAAGEQVRVEDLGSFLAPFYDDPEERRVTDDLEFLGDRLYIAHGYTNTKTPQQLVYYDLAELAYGRHENPDGTPMTWRIEKTYRTHRIGEELFILDYDPLSGPSKLLRVRPDGGVATQHVSNDAHNRDVTVFDGKLFVSHGRTDVPWPSMRWSRDDGATWEQIEQPGVSERSLYECYFTLDGRLYAGTHSKGWRPGYRVDRGATPAEMAANMVTKTDVPWVIRYTGREYAPWEPVIPCADVDRILGVHPDGGSPLSDVIYKALDAGEDLLTLISNRAYVFRSLDPPAASPLALGTLTTVTDFYRDDAGRHWILAHERPPELDPDAETGATPDADPATRTTVGTGTGLIFEYLGGGRVRRAAVFASERSPRCLAVRGGIAYLGYHGGHLKRVRLP